MNLLELKLFKHCHDGDSGVVFISTDDNQACRIILNNGVLIAANMGVFKGFNALEQLKKSGIKDASFKNNMKLPYKDEEKLESSDTALTFLGYSGSLLETAATAKNKAAAPEYKAPSRKEEVKKSVRMYRGQVVE